MYRERKLRMIAHGDDIEKAEPDKLLIFLLRHGKPEFPDERSYIYGQTDYPLSKEGEAQARRVGEALSEVRMDRIISSDLSRAASTADIVASLQRPPAVPERDAGIREINMGEWDGLTKDEISGSYVDIFRERGKDLEHVAAPGGETFREVSDRGLSSLRRIVESSRGMERILLVAHGAVMWGMVCGLFDMRLGDIFRFGLDHCAIHLIEHRRKPAQWGQFRLVRYNWSPVLVDYNDDLV
jgi:broad specificity phosphatase PhoE